MSEKSFVNSDGDSSEFDFDSEASFGNLISKIDVLFVCLKVLIHDLFSLKSILIYSAYHVTSFVNFEEFDI